MLRDCVFFFQVFHDSRPTERRVEDPEVQSFTICKELGGGGEEGLQMVLGTLPTTAGIPSCFINLEMFTYKMWNRDAVSTCLLVHVRVHMCVCVWSKETLGSRDSGWGEDQGVGGGKMVSGPDWL